VDSRGLLVKGREQLSEHKSLYAHDHMPCTDLLSAVQALKPTMLVGVSGQPKAFSRQIVEQLARYNERPVVFALSNPSSKARMHR